jgi:RHS repeat-associated protein
VWLDGRPLAEFHIAADRRLVRMSYLHVDQGGQLQYMTGANGRMVMWSLRGDAFGHDRTDLLDVDGDRVQEQPLIRGAFRGQVHDGFQFYNYYRDYDPVTGRYLESDPLGLAGGLNLYAYAGGNPIASGDPLGLMTQDCRRPLHFFGDGQTGNRSGPDNPYNPMHHRYICVVQGAITICGGQDRSAGPYSPGRPSDDDFDPDYCRLAEPDNACFEDCLLGMFDSPRPFYGLIGPGTNCQEWADDALSRCRAQCARR